jgi:ribonuclease Z
VRTLFLPSLVNGLSGDPALWIDLLDEGRAVLFDLGDVGALASRKLLRVDHVVVTHTHLDHFAGFDRLLRLVLRREREIVLTGPLGFVDRVEARLASYTWNLISSYPVRLRVQEVAGGTVFAAAFSGAGGMRREALPATRFSGTVHAERLFTVEVAALDHGVPVLGAALREVEHLSIDRDRLGKAGLAPGPWLRELKDAVRRREPGDLALDAEGLDGSRRSLRLDGLEAELIRRGPGQRLAYVTDVADTPDNVAAIVALAREADVFFCEAPFLEADAGEARARRHLTARRAGEIARAAGAKRLAPFHLSPRYQGREREILREAGDAFGGPILVPPFEPSGGFEDGP